MGMNPQDFRPVYDDTVREMYSGDTDGSTLVSISPQYCLSLPSAIVLASFFNPVPKITLAPPIVQATGSPFVFSHNVPWLDFGNGITRNAGLLAGYWGMAGVPYSQALSYAQLDVSTTVEGQ
jgi:hypothetical protein